ncbi:unnamed protein product [Cylindrotheca closterium]|uniref:Uncharacterized protein n=1 Tax=Cylindrotheca closterium TaxID=2856 RepID=A0AAD2JMS6_9STRA|nr:unnamed protein product [Cylindrotheca closterium]
MDRISQESHVPPSASCSDSDEEPAVVFWYTGGKSEDIPRRVTHIQIDPSVEGIPFGAFQGLLHLIEIRLDDRNNSTLRRIGPRVFFSCSALKQVAIPQLVRSISNSTFSRCVRLRQVTFPEGLVEIGSDAFNGCVSLGIVQFPSTLLRIGPSAFKGCNGLQEVDLPLALKEISFGAFQDCMSLQMIAIPPMVQNIVNNAFDNCQSLGTVKLSEGVRMIDTYAFRLCRSLRSVAIPSSMFKIGRGAFSQCRSLETVEFAKGNLQILNGLAFADCPKLCHVALPGTINTLYSNSFEGCETLQLLPRSDPDENLTDFLSKRFENLPVHNLCYLNVHRPVSETLEAIQVFEEASFALNKHCDCLGMTPFHILAASSRPNLSLFEALSLKYPQEHWNQSDLVKGTPMTHLILNPAPESNAIIQNIARTVLHNRLAALGSEQWRLQVEDLIDASSVAPVPERLKLFQHMLQRFRWCEQKEACSLLEQVVWKVKIQQATLKSGEWRDDECKEMRESALIAEQRL